MATPEMANWLIQEHGDDDVLKVLFCQESRWVHLAEDMKPFFHHFNLVLTNNKDLVGKNAAYMTLFGTWITRYENVPKTCLVSTIASSKDTPGVEGYKIRKAVRRILDWKIDGYGPLYGRRIQDKWDALTSYYFSIAIESEWYPWWHTEKLFDCFATRTIPLYWGCHDFSKLKEWGYDPAGIVSWSTVEELETLLPLMTVEFYESKREVIESNFQRTRELYCVEVPMEKVIREALF